ncbi:hypothetical protein V499_06688 [Pseudogymnoascus sp. VKM F-103]|uniref:Mid2 domain-containing protein n=1 Tax=Pseudogymnoascus verrucosus TaxID=342668 RepID=A0A2P2SXQ3_9PEZI|nr:uncharacterized protein VE01_00128 [Pseudogymnoascus verrucosus]KFY73217.1 hypothetical protein V499_06688 [Pseudogymnoascus sp. VKM F-103]OBU01631.1 hypothetical protein VE01_00128 [Pseudogymnoascus verrucosus]
MHLPTPLLLLTLTTLLPSALAGPFPRNAGHDYAGSGFLMHRQCDSYCGYGDAYCCSAGQVCTTDAANIAACVAPTAGSGGGGDGSWNYYTTTIIDAVETTRVVTISSFIGAPASPQPYVAQSTAICYAPLTSCGTICCATNQECYTSGQCRAKQDGSGGGGVVTSGPQPTAPVKGTSVIATTVPITTTQGFVAPVETTGSSETITSGHKSGLSGGAIAGIVIGVLAGIIFLLFLCACCCLSAGIKGVWHLISGKKKGDSRRGSRTEVTTETRRHSTRYGGSAASRRETHGGWFGGAVPSGRDNEKHDKHKKEAVGLAGLGLGLAALWAGMKFNKKKKEERRQSGSYYTSYTESYTGTTDSSSSSGGRTRNSRRSRSRR